MYLTIIVFNILLLNRIDDVMVGVFTSSAIDR